MDEWINMTSEMENSTDGEEMIPYPNRPETYIVPVVFALIFIVGVLGNGTLIVIFLRHNNMRNVPNTYIFSLAVGDLLVIVSCVPFISTVYTVASYPFGELICKLSEGVKDISIGVSVFTLTALSADRFFAIVDPMRTLHTSSGRATRFTIMVALSIWVLAVVCAIPAFMYSYIRYFPDDEHPLFAVCYPFPKKWYNIYPKVNVITKFFVYYAVPLFIIGFFYILMARHLIQSTQNIPGEMHGQVRQIRARRKVAKMVLAFVIIFAVCFFPYHTFMIWFYTTQDSEEKYNGFWHTFRIIGFCLSFINSCINPIALYCVSGAFRKHFNRYLLCCFCRGRDNGRGNGGTSMNVSKRGASRRFNSKSTWDSSTMAQFQHSTVRHHPQQLLLNQRDDITVTTFINCANNGGGNGVGRVGGVVTECNKKMEPRIISFN